MTVCKAGLELQRLPHVCWRMLTYADLCWRKPSSRMLTYADVCWLMLVGSPFSLILNFNTFLLINSIHGSERSTVVVAILLTVPNARPAPWWGRSSKVSTEVIITNSAVNSVVKSVVCVCNVCMWQIYIHFVCMYVFIYNECMYVFIYNKRQCVHILSFLY
jgi:hypothetical protein